jgi:hypothetical protein
LLDRDAPAYTARRMDIRSLIEDFTNQLSSLLERDALDRARVAVEAALGGGGSPGKLRSAGRRPKQLCPVPGCKNPAAPVFGMVCAKHQDIPKTKIKQYREARRAKKDKGKGKVTRRRVTRRTRVAKAA